MSKKQTQTTLHHFKLTKQQNKQTHQEPSKKQNIKKQQSQQSGQSDLSHHSSTQKLHEQTKPKTEKIRLHNVQFYRNQIKSQPHGDLIDDIHKNWWKNYKLLQSHHGFIQWLFPNSFTSRFNPSSYALSLQEQKIFRTDIRIARNYVTSYQMILQFYGMKLKNKVSGQITQQRIVNYKQRYHATLLTSFHNHMRITRILCSLAMIGFGRYAKQLSLFLKQQIHTEKGNLKSLAKYNVDKDWKSYQNYVQTEQDLNIYLKQAGCKSHHDKQAILQKYNQQNLQKFGKDVQKSQLDHKQHQKQNKKKQKQQVVIQKHNVTLNHKEKKQKKQ